MTSRNLTYIADRVLRLVAVGQPVITNNPGVAELFADVPGAAVLFRPDPARLCGDAVDYVRRLRDPAGIHALMDHVAAYHTYLSRWHAYLSFLRAVLADRSAAVGAGGEEAGGAGGFGCGNTDTGK